MLSLLSTLAGHVAQRAALARLLTVGRPAHALLFEGPVGVGKSTLASAVAATLACLRPNGAESDRPGDACGSCRSCLALARGEHPDVARVEAQGRTIKIEQVRALAPRLRYEPVLGRHKVVLLLEADRMGEEAANALLKTLEEPPSRTHFLLVSSRPQLLLDTIRSRCQTLRFGPLAAEEICTVLASEAAQRGQAIDPALLRLGAALGDGSLSAARLRADPAWHPVVAAVVDAVVHLGLRPVGHEVGQVEVLSALIASAPALQTGGDADADPNPEAGTGSKGKGLDRERLLVCLDLLRAVLRDAVLIGAGIDATSLPHAPWAAALQGLARRVGVEPLASAIEELERTEAASVYNPSPQLALEATLAAMARHARAGR